jgi:hypothetical protein
MVFWGFEKANVKTMNTPSRTAFRASRARARATTNGQKTRFCPLVGNNRFCSPAGLCTTVRTARRPQRRSWVQCGPVRTPVQLHLHIAGMGTDAPPIHCRSQLFGIKEALSYLRFRLTVSKFVILPPSPPLHYSPNILTFCSQIRARSMCDAHRVSEQCYAIRNSMYLLSNQYSTFHTVHTPRLLSDSNTGRCSCCPFIRHRQLAVRSSCLIAL